ncbi:MAG: DNA translocase FtsK 4TM domain-containing protein, partial [Prolixibacteraceae bacterium]
MAKKITKKEKAPTPSKISGIVHFFKSNQFKYTLGLLFMIISGYLTVAFVSYIFSGAVDQSKLDLPLSDLFFDPSIQVDNIAGKGGALLSEQFINLGFGFSSFFIVVILFVGALNLFGSKKINFLRTLIFSILWMLWFSITLGLALTNVADNQFLNIGGMYGFILSSFLSSILGSFGAALILIFALFVLLIVTFKQIIPWLTHFFTKKQTETPVAEQQDKSVALENVPEVPFQIEDLAISKIITEDDQIKAIFDPDSGNDEIVEDFEIENTVSQKDVEMSIEDLLFSEEPKPQPKVKSEPELQVQKKVEEEYDEIEPAVMSDYDPTLDLSSYKYPS